MKAEGNPAIMLPMSEPTREFTIVLSVAGFQFPDVDRLMRWLEQTSLSQEALHRYLPDGAAVLVRGVVSNLPEDAPFLDAPEGDIAE